MQTGIYEQLLTSAVKKELDQLSDPRFYSLVDVDAEDAHSTVAQFLEHVIAKSLSRLRGSDAGDRQRRLIEQIIGLLKGELDSDELDHISIADPLRRLLAIHSTARADVQTRPDTPLSRSALLTGTRVDPSLGSQLRKELQTCDRVDILCSFIRWSGLRLILDDLRALAEQGGVEYPRIRVITTSYMGATDPRAVEALSALPNCEVRVSYDTKRTRLHAKAYLFHRSTGFGSAYVGSANLSNAALSEGLEWTTKISQYELPHLWGKIQGSFETYWEDDEFEPFTPEARGRLRDAIARENSESSLGESSVTFDLRPWPFQEEILDTLAAEREIQQKSRHLVVAATGTGKTMIAAFDYDRVRRLQGSTPSLLFVAHREEILRQALATFRGVLRNHNFGDLLVGGREVEDSRHLFCSIQSYNSRELWKRQADEFAYVVVDEFHHAAAPSYQRLLSHLKPKILLGLTATPERADELDVLHWFGGAPSAAIRLPDAINRRLLCPFHYFGVSDSVDLDSLTWQRGGYRLDELDRVYTGNDARARLILDKVREYLLDARKSRGLGFCVSVAHAEFMSRFFNANGLPAICLSGTSPDDVRFAAQEQLRNRNVNFIFVVDLYNEGVDLPEIDTLLFLRPTESLTIYLQQFGRGLRQHPDKECLTVLDFIGAQRQEFRFAPRFRAMSVKPTEKLDNEIDRGFPHLPAGCVVQLERVAQQRVLENVRQSIRLMRPSLVRSIRELATFIGRPPTIGEALNYLDTSIDELLKRGTWSQLIGDAGLAPVPNDPNLDELAGGMRRVAHIDDAERIQYLLSHLRQTGLSDSGDKYLQMLHVVLWGRDGIGWSTDLACERLRANASVVQDLCAILEFRLAHSPTHRHGRLPELSGPLTIHSLYSRDEILVGLGHWTMDRRPQQQEGTLHLRQKKVDAFFVTLQKTEDEYSPTTMYEDYLISHGLFHWQTQSTTSSTSPTAQRYFNHRSLGYTPLLFVRETRRNEAGTTNPYAYLGPCEYVSHEGSRPVSVTWRLRYPVPARLYRALARQATG